MTEIGTGETIETALDALGVRDDTLSEQERRSLDERGYVLLDSVLDSVWLDRLRETYEELMEREGQSAGREVHQEQGTRRLADLVNKGDVFDRVYTNPRVLAAVHHVLRRDFKLSSLNGRDALPGEGHQPLHADWGPRNPDEPFQVVNSIWMIDAFTPDNGATRVVPGTHLLRGGPADHMPQGAAADHPEQVLLTAPAGSVGVFNAHVWHGGTQNQTEGTRRAIHCYFTAREHDQQLNQAEYVRKATFDRISPAARYILDVG